MKKIFIALLFTILVSGLALAADFTPNSNIQLKGRFNLTNASYVCLGNDCRDTWPAGGGGSGGGISTVRNTDGRLNVTNGTTATIEFNLSGNQDLNETDEIIAINSSTNIKRHGFNLTTELKNYFDTFYLTISSLSSYINTSYSFAGDVTGTAGALVVDQKFNETSRITDLNTSTTANNSAQALLIGGLLSSNDSLWSNASGQQSQIVVLQGNDSAHNSSIGNLWTNASNQEVEIKALQANVSGLNSTVSTTNAWLNNLSADNRTLNLSVTNLQSQKSNIVVCTGGNSTHANVSNSTSGSNGSCIMVFHTVTTQAGGGSGMTILNLNSSTNSSVLGNNSIISILSGAGITTTHIGGSNPNITINNANPYNDTAVATAVQNTTILRNGTVVNFVTVNTTTLNAGSTNLTTSQVSEGSNLYYTDARASSSVQNTTILRNGTNANFVTLNGTTVNAGTLNAGSTNLTTAQISEGSNLYYTDTRASSSVQNTTILRNGTHANFITLNGTTVNAGTLNAGSTNLTTSQVSEGSNLYYTDARASSSVQNTTILRNDTNANFRQLNVSNNITGTNLTLSGVGFIAGSQICTAGNGLCVAGGGLSLDQSVNTTYNVTFAGVLIRAAANALLRFNTSGFNWTVGVEDSGANLKFYDNDGSVLLQLNKDSDSVTGKNVIAQGTFSGATPLTSTGSSGQTNPLFVVENNTGADLVVVEPNGTLNASKGIRTNLTSCDSIDTLSDGTLVCGTDASGDGAYNITYAVGISNLSVANVTLNLSVTNARTAIANLETANQTLNASVLTLIGNSSFMLRNNTAANFTNVRVSEYVNFTQTGNVSHYAANSCYTVSNATGLYWIC